MMRQKASREKKISYKLPEPYAELDPNGPPEALIQAELIGYLEARGAWCQRVHTGAIRVQGRSIRSNAKGCPDVLACYKGRLLGLEVKKSGGTVSQEQIDYLKAMAEAGAYVAIVVRPARMRAALLQIQNRRDEGSRAAGANILIQGIPVV